MADGYKDRGRINTNNDDFDELVSCIPYKIQTVKQESQNGIGFTIKGFETLLKSENLLINKHIPHQYLYGDYGTRLNLLKGFMDGNGGIKGKRDKEKITVSYNFTQKNSQLLKDLLILIRSLGCK
ncbi:MAG: hypothetical protein LBR15_03725 [Methanobrevibacter sp.]|nr:hypothetical protein [Candidatus Methanovirga australis]